jgi:hypothetical protein
MNTNEFTQAQLDYIEDVKRHETPIESVGSKQMKYEIMNLDNGLVGIVVYGQHENLAWALDAIKIEKVAYDGYTHYKFVDQNYSAVKDLLHQTGEFWRNL